MPLGVALSLEGMLLAERRRLVLQMDDGGTWQLEVGRAAWKMLGKRVRIDGERDEFNLVAVRRIVVATQVA